jgi:hypothetical protein
MADMFFAKPPECDTILVGRKDLRFAAGYKFEQHSITITDTQKYFSLIILYNFILVAWSPYMGHRGLYV